MKTVFELSESEIEEAIREWVERKNTSVEVFAVQVGHRFLDGRAVAFANVSFVTIEKPKKPKKHSGAAQAAADVLGGSGGAMDRSGGLSQGLDEDEV